MVAPGAYGLGAFKGLAEGGIEELEEFRFNCSWKLRTSSSSSTMRFSSSAHRGQPGVEADVPSLMRGTITDGQHQARAITRRKGVEVTQATTADEAIARKHTPYHTGN